MFKMMTLRDAFSPADKCGEHGVCAVGDSTEGSVLVRADRFTIAGDNEASEVYLFRPPDTGKHSPDVSGTEGAQVRPLLCV